MGDRLKEVGRAYDESTRLRTESNQSVVKKIAKLEKLGSTRKRSNAATKSGGRMVGGRSSVIPTQLAQNLDEDNN